MTDDLALLKERVNLRVGLWSILIALAGLGILLISTPIGKAGYARSGVLLEESGAALFIAGVLAVIWEWGGKRAFADEVLAKANMSRDLAEAGVDTIVMSFKDHRVDWDILFKNACRLDLFVAWGATWRNTQAEQIEKLLSDPDAKLRVVFPDPEVPHIRESLAARFTMDGEAVKRMINEARDFFQHQKEKASGRGKLEIYFSAVVPVFTFYKFNNKAVLALYNHRIGKTPVPALVCDRDGFLFKFIAAEFEGILADTRTRRVDEEKAADEQARVNPAKA